MIDSKACPFLAQNQASSIVGAGFTPSSVLTLPSSYFLAFSLPMAPKSKNVQRQSARRQRQQQSASSRSWVNAASLPSGEARGSSRAQIFEALLSVLFEQENVCEEALVLEKAWQAKDEDNLPSEGHQADHSDGCDADLQIVSVEPDAVASGERLPPTPVLNWHLWSQRHYGVSVPYSGKRNIPADTSAFTIASNMWTRAERKPFARAWMASLSYRREDPSTAAAYYVTLSDAPHPSCADNRRRILEWVQYGYAPPCNFCGAPTYKISSCARLYTCERCTEEVPSCCRRCLSDGDTVMNPPL